MKFIQNQLNPTAQVAEGETEAPAWDGAASKDTTVSDTALQNRAALKKQVTSAMASHVLNARINQVKPKKAEQKLPMTRFEGAGHAAKKVVDEVFGEWATNAALTTPQRHTRDDHQFRASGPNQNLFDATDKEQRRLGGQPVNINDLANWVFNSEAKSLEAQIAHNFNPARSDEEQNFLNTEILQPFISRYPRVLAEYDLYGFGMADPLTGKIVAAPQVSSADIKDFGEENAINIAQWEMWKVLAHEYIHTLEHPVSRAAGMGNRVILEGFCQMFTEEALVPAVNAAASDYDLIFMVEGDDWFTFDDKANIIGGYQTPPDYVNYLNGALNIRDTMGDNAVKAAYFQGHVEYIGLLPDGQQAAPENGYNVDRITRPEGITTWDQLAAATGVEIHEIIALNAEAIPGLTELDPVPEQLYVPDCRDHEVIQVTDAASNTALETKKQIADQNGVSEAALVRANPNVNWAALVDGQRVLIPSH
ncbi:MAG: hypothetical protein ACYDEO_19365 [Aggregatilineales bacterium]